MTELVKLVVTVPLSDADAVRHAVGKAGGGTVGNYAFCSFSSRGVGRYLPQAGAHPAIGEVDRLEHVEEEHIEFTCDKNMITEIIAALKAVHPYEEPAIDVYPLLSV